MKILIRPMVIGDYREVLGLWKRSFNKIYPQDSRESLKKTLEMNPDSCLVAVSGGRIVGTILGTYDFRFGYLYRLAVDPGSRGSGAGPMLVREAEKALRKRGARKICLFYLRRKGLINYYRGLGYESLSHCLMKKTLK